MLKHLHKKIVLCLLGAIALYFIVTKVHYVFILVGSLSLLFYPLLFLIIAFFAEDVYNIYPKCKEVIERFKTDAKEDPGQIFLWIFIQSISITLPSIIVLCIPTGKNDKGPKIYELIDQWIRSLI